MGLLHIVLLLCTSVLHSQKRMFSNVTAHMYHQPLGSNLSHKRYFTLFIMKKGTCPLYLVDFLYDIFVSVFQRSSAEREKSPGTPSTPGSEASESSQVPVTSVINRKTRHFNFFLTQTISTG